MITIDPGTTWLMLLACFALGASVMFYVDESLDRLLAAFAGRVKPATKTPVQDPERKGCPCMDDPTYHEWMTYMLMLDDERLDQEDHL